MNVSPYLMFNGNCEEAFKFYEAKLGGKVDQFFKYGDSPMADKVPSDWKDKIMHVSMTLASQKLMGADGMPGQPYSGQSGFSLAIGVNEATEAERIFAILADGGNITMPIQETFWALRFGMVTDKFGTPWMINCEQGAPKH